MVESPAHYQHLINHNTALLCIDMQYLDAAEGYGVFEDPEKSGIPEEGRRYYFDSLRDHVLPNMKKLQDTFRAFKLEVIHTRIQSMTQDGRDRGSGHKRLNLHAAPHSKESEFLQEVAPVGDEIIINKTASGVFSCTNMDYILRNLGISALFIVGVYTNECVETTVRDACDLGYLVTMIEDCCTTVTPALHQATLTTLRDRYARIMTTQEALKELEQYVRIKHHNH